MKKTVNINISGYVFHIDEDAYLILKDYLNKITVHFKTEEGGHEIVNDIESRIAELFFEKTGSKQGVINVQMVDSIIETMGLPEDFAENETTSEDETNDTIPINTVHHRNKKLYRDPDSKILGGVCSGLGYYLNINKAVIRILFLILFFITSGTAFFAYVILWIAVPKARTTTQRLDMKGEAINVENIGRSVKEEFSEMKDGTPTSGSYRYEREITPPRTGQGIGNVFSKIFGILFILIGFFTTSILLFTFMVASKIIGIVPGLHSGLLVNHIFSGSMATTMSIAIIIILIIPLLLLLYAGTKMLFNYVSNSRSVVLSALGVWVIAIIVAFSSGAGAIDIFSSDASDIQIQELTPCDTLFISINQEQNKAFNHSPYEVNHVKVMMINDKERLVAHPKFTIEASDDEDFKLKIKKYSKGNNYRNAQQNSNSLTYSFTNSENQLQLDPYFLMDENGKWRNQEVKITLQIANGQVVFLDESLLPIIHDIENTNNTWDGDMTNTFWVMKPEGLTQCE